MSLVNQVLRDLQARQVNLSCELTDLRPAEWGGGRRILRRLAVPVLTMMVVVPAYAAWQWKSAQPSVPVPAAKYELEELVVPLAHKRIAVTLEPAVDVALPALESSVEGDVREDVPHDADVSRPPARLAAHAAPAPAHADTPAVEEMTSSASSSPGKVESTLTKRTSTDPRTLAAQAVRRGLNALNGRDLQGAERHFRAAVTAYPRDGVAWAHLYEVLDRQGNADGAAAAAAEGLQKATDPSVLTLRYARALIAHGELEQALSVLERHRPARIHSAYQALLAWLLQQNARHREAAEIYRELIARRPAAGDWWIGLAISLESLGHASEALKAFERGQATSGLKAPLAEYATQRIVALRLRN